MQISNQTIAVASFIIVLLAFMFLANNNEASLPDEAWKQLDKSLCINEQQMRQLHCSQ